MKTALKRTAAAVFLSGTFVGLTPPAARTEPISVAAAVTGAAALATIITTAVSRKKTPSGPLADAGEHTRGVAASLGQAAQNAGKQIKNDVMALKDGVVAGAQVIKAAAQARRGAHKARNFFARHGIALSVILSLLATTLGGAAFYNNSKS